jgi:hypothetical protein
MNADTILNQGREGARTCAPFQQQTATTATEQSSVSTLPGANPATAVTTTRPSSPRRRRGQRPATAAGRSKKQEPLSPKELRGARAERIIITESGDGGWVAHSEAIINERYLLYVEPENLALTCTCADYIFRGGDDKNYACKHSLATLRFIGRRYIETYLAPLLPQPPSMSGDKNRAMLY